MLLDIQCNYKSDTGIFRSFSRYGRLQLLEDGTLRLMGRDIIYRERWQVSCTNIVKVEKEDGIALSKIVISTQHKNYTVHNVVKQQAALFLGTLSDLVDTGQQKWYHDSTQLTHVATYPYQLLLQKEAEAAAHYGWVIQTTSAMDRQRTPVGSVYTTGRATGRVLAPEPIIVTFGRTAEWLSQNREK